MINMLNKRKSCTCKLPVKFLCTSVNSHSRLHALPVHVLFGPTERKITGPTVESRHACLPDSRHRKSSFPIHRYMTVWTMAGRRDGGREQAFFAEGRGPRSSPRSSIVCLSCRNLHARFVRLRRLSRRTSSSSSLVGRQSKNFFVEAVIESR
jgi:hypothetical protein